MHASSLLAFGIIFLLFLGNLLAEQNTAPPDLLAKFDLTPEEALPRMVFSGRYAKHLPVYFNNIKN